MKFRLETVDECPSTQDVLFARRGDPRFHGSAVLALRQTNAFGRRGRAWSSGAGNLSLSLALDFSECESEVSLLPFRAGLALFLASASYLPASAVLRLKWPNDLYLDGKKLSGLLTQVRQSGNKTVELVLGVGLNLAEVPAGFEKEATAIAMFADPPAPEAFAREFLSAFEKELAGRRDFPGLRARWEKAARLHEGVLFVLGEKDPVHPLELLPGGELLVRDSAGRERKLSSEDVSLRFTAPSL